MIDFSLINFLVGAQYVASPRYINNAYANTFLAEISFILPPNLYYLVRKEYTWGDRLSEVGGEWWIVNGELAGLTGAGFTWFT